MGYNIGLRLIEDFLARSGLSRCNSMRETAEVISKVGFKMFLNITPTVDNWSPDNKSFSLILDENPLAEFVELPDDGKAVKELWYSNILTGVIKGALEMVQLEVEAYFVQDQLQGAPQTEIKVRFVKVLEDDVPAGEDWFIFNQTQKQIKKKIKNYILFFNSIFRLSVVTENFGFCY